MSALTDAYEQIHDGQLTCYDASTITIIGTAAAGTYVCGGGELAEKNELALGGFIDEPHVIVFVKASLLPAEPVLQTRVTYRGKTFKIDAIRSSEDGTVLIFDLMPTK